MAAHSKHGRKVPARRPPEVSIPKGEMPMKHPKGMPPKKMMRAADGGAVRVSDGYRLPPDFKPPATPPPVRGRTSADMQARQLAHSPPGRIIDRRSATAKRNAAAVRVVKGKVVSKKQEPKATRHFDTRGNYLGTW